MSASLPASAHTAAPGVPFPDDLVLTPLSRRPTLLEPATLRAILDRPLPAYPRAASRSPLATVVVVTRDNLPFLRLCLESVLAASEDRCELVVVDNGSRDGTEAYLTDLAALNPQVQKVRNPSNRGFAAGCNEGAGHGEAGLLVFLNDDTVVTPGWLPRLTAHLGDARTGMVGPTTNRIGNEAQIDTSYRTWGELARFAVRRAEEHAGEAFEIPTLTMFCVAIRRALYLDVGPLDERFETGLLEDDDYSRRVRDAGYRLLCADDAFVHHFGETSFGKLVPSGEYARLLDANRAKFERKWGEAWQPYGRRPSASYHELAVAIRKVVAEIVPPGGIVLVVSRGDEDLLRLEGHEAWHFPCSDNGVYAGHHPADSEEAISGLEEQRSAGAGHIVFPRTGLWWLDHYDGLRRHLDGSYERVFDDPQTCVVYELRSSSV